MGSPPQATWQRRRIRRAAVEAVVDAGSLVVTALRLLGRHWPVLLALFLTGALAKDLVMRVAVQASRVNAELGMLVLLLAPVTTLTALVLMLRVVRPSLPALSASGQPPSMIEHLASVLIPFIVIYEIDGGLDEDLLSYNVQILDDLLQRSFERDLESFDDRVPYDLSVTLVGVVVAVIIARWLWSRVTDAAPRHRWLGLPGAYLELVWIVLVLVVAIGSVLDLAMSWGGDRRVVQATLEGWDQLTGQTGAGPVLWISERLGQIDTVLVIPLAWLAVGAVVIGTTDYEPPDLTTTAFRERALYQRARTGWLAMPRPVQWVLSELTADVQDRLSLLGQGARLLWRAGLPLMMLFCLAFIATDTLADWLWRLQRLLIGPRDPEGVWEPIEWPLSVLNEAVGTAVLICLLAAAIERAAHDSLPQRPVQQNPVQPDSVQREPGVGGLRVENRQP